MENAHLISEINRLKSQIGHWQISLGKHSAASFVIGYYLNPATKKYDVFENNERGFRGARESFNSETEALQEVLEIVECRAEEQRYM